MKLRILPLFFLAACIADETHKAEKWNLESYELNLTCFVNDSEPDNFIIDTFVDIIGTFVDWNDSSNVEPSLILQEDFKFSIVKNGSEALSGTWHLRAQEELILTTGNHQWNLKIESQNSDSLVLRSDVHYKHLVDLRMVLKH